MHYLELTLPRPEENLACDEALLDTCEEGQAPPILRFWEPRQPFVVLGYGNKIDTEVNVDFCEQNSISILRRCTGGGTVLQVPGCLNYSLILPISSETQLHTVSATNRFITGRNADALAELTRLPVRVEGCTDLGLNGLKFSGNSQRRRKNSLLFHGSFLLSADISLIEKTLALPSKEPDYRQNRSHADFLINLKVSAAEIKAVLRNVWGASQLLINFPHHRVTALCREKYDLASWNRKF
jgi:lipoate-protein ligase A